jgi:hypothetical protein
MIQPTYQVPQESIESRILRELHDAIASQVTKLTEAIISDAKQRFEDELRAKLGMAAITLTNYYSVEHQGGNLIITVKIEDKR